jgi:hypothetical protein
MAFYDYNNSNYDLYFNDLKEDIDIIIQNIDLILEDTNHSNSEINTLSNEIKKASSFAMKSYNNPMTVLKKDELNIHGKFFHLNYRKFCNFTKDLLKVVRTLPQDEFIERHCKDIKTALTEIAIKTKK